jgi:hypothetical protein
MMGILGYEIPALLELLQEIGIEQMGASLLAKGLVSEVDGFLGDDGMEETREEGTAKDAVGLLELDNRGIVGGKEHVEVGTEVSDPVHLRHAFELGQEIEEALYLLFVLGSERLGIDREIGLFVSVTDDTSVETILDLLDVDMILVGDLRHVVQDGVLSPYFGYASLAELMVNHSDDVLHTDTFPPFEKSVKDLLSHTVILTIRHNIFNFESDPDHRHADDCMVARSVHGGGKVNDASRYIAYRAGVMTTAVRQDRNRHLSCKFSKF